MNSIDKPLKQETSATRVCYRGDWFLEELDCLVPCEPQPDYDEWRNAVSDAFVSWASDDVNRLWWTMTNEPDWLIGISDDLPVISGMFPPASMGWIEWMDLLNSIGEV